MHSSRAAHLGEDGRWIAIPVRVVPDGLPTRVILLLLSCALFGVILTFLSTYLSSASSTLRAVLWVGIAILTVVAIIAIASFVRTVTASFMRRRWPKFDDRTLPIRATATVTRVPLSERNPSASDINAAEHRARSIKAHPELDLKLTPWLEQEGSDFTRLAEETELDELAVARGYAASLRLIDCRGYSDLPLSARHFEMLEEELGRPVPRLWAIDDAPLPEVSSRGESPPKRRWSTRIGPTFAGSKLWLALFIAAVPLMVINLLTKNNVIPPGTLPQAVLQKVFIVFVVAAFALFIWWELRSQAFVLVDREGGLTLKRILGRRAPIPLDPPVCRALVYHKYPDRDFRHTHASGLTPPIWRFMVDGSETSVEVSDFDPRGTTWWPLVQELQAAPFDAGR